MPEERHRPPAMPTVRKSGLPTPLHPASRLGEPTLAPGLPLHVAAQVLRLTPAHLPVVHVECLPQPGRWRSLRCDPPRVPGLAFQAPVTSAGAYSSISAAQPPSSGTDTVRDPTTGISFAVRSSQPGAPVATPAVAALQAVFAAPAGQLINEADLLQLEQVATVVPVVRRVRIASPRGRAQLGYQTVYGDRTPGVWYIRWHLAHRSARGGFIVQHITIWDPGTHQYVNYWEAWHIKPGARLTDDPDSTFDDQFLWELRADRSPLAGAQYHAEARFYEGMRRLPSTFKTYNDDTLAAGLPSTTRDPHLATDNASPAVTRWWLSPGPGQGNGAPR